MHYLTGWAASHISKVGRGGLVHHVSSATMVPPASFHVFVGCENWKALQTLSALALHFSSVSWKILRLPLGSLCWLEVDLKQALRPSNSSTDIFQSLSILLLLFGV